MRIAAALAVIVLVSGCTLLPCNKPMVRIRGQCCLDGNGNGVCDSVEEQYGYAADCQLPYIEYPAGCCLDSNGNKVCDSLEERETPAESSPTTTPIPTSPTTLTTLHSTTSSTLATQQSTSSTLANTSTTSSTLLANGSTTSTTLPASTTTSSTTSSTLKVTYLPTSTTLPLCRDSDGGETWDVQGTTSGLRRHPPRDRITVSDYCLSNTTVIEYRCQDDMVYLREHVCAFGQICTGGRCCLPVGVQCGSASECCSGVCRGKYVSLCR